MLANTAYVLMNNWMMCLWLIPPSLQPGFLHVCTWERWLVHHNIGKRLIFNVEWLAKMCSFCLKWWSFCTFWLCMLVCRCATECECMWVWEHVSLCVYLCQCVSICRLVGVRALSCKRGFYTVVCVYGITQSYSCFVCRSALGLSSSSNLHSLIVTSLEFPPWRKLFLRATC